MLVAFDRIQGMVKAMVGSRPSQAAFRGDFCKQSHKVEAFSPKNGGVQLDSAE
jgi:hypothetical protein